MAETFTLPEELFNSMINSFNSNDKTEQANIGVDQNKKNKTDGSNKTALDVTQKRRLGNVANVWFGDDLVKFFQSDFKKQIKQIEDVELEETKQKLEIIKKEEVKKVEKKKAKKKMSLKRMMKMFRIMTHIIKLIMDLKENFEKFKGDTHSIFQRYFAGEDYTVKGILTDEKERSRFVKSLKAALKETVKSFYENMIINSLIPLLEFLCKMILEKIIDILSAITDKAEAIASLSGASELLKTFAKKLGKVLIKKAAKFLAKTLAKQAAAHAVAAGAAATGIGAPVAAAIEIGLWLWTLYDVAMLVKEGIDALEKLKEAGYRFGTELVEAGNAMQAMVMDGTIDAYLDNFGVVAAGVLPDSLSQFRDSILKFHNKVATYKNLFNHYSSNIDNIINEFDDETKFDEDELKALSTMKDKEKYRPYRFLISHYAKFFKKFKETASLTFEIIKGMFPDLNLFADIKNIEINAKAKISKLYVNDDDEDDFRREPYKADNILKRNNKRLEIKLFNFNGLKYKKLKVHRNRTELFVKCLKVIKEVEDKRKKERLKTT